MNEVSPKLFLLKICFFAVKRMGSPCQSHQARGLEDEGNFLVVILSR